MNGTTAAAMLPWLHRAACLAMLAAGLSAPSLADDAADTSAAAGGASHPEAEQRKLAERILQNTKAARDKLGEQFTDDKTQKVQQTVVDDLERLIDMLRKSPPPSSNQNPPPDSGASSSSSAQNQQQQQQRSGQKPKPSAAAQGAGTGAEQNREQPPDSEERHGDAQELKNSADRKRRLESDIWGHLPPALRERLLNTYGGRMLPQYEDYVRKFYDALSEPSRPQKR